MRGLLLILFSAIVGFASAQKLKTRIVKVDSGWSRNSINTTVFRKNSLTSFGNWQYIAYYNKNGFVVLAKRK